MKIKNVEELVGITRKNIRFYEEQGLLSPQRAENGYREYHQKDIERLQKIKLFRKLDIPIEDIKRLFEGELSLYECLDRSLDRLERKKGNLDQMQAVSRELMESHATIQTLRTEVYLNQIEQLEKGGTDFISLDKTDIHRRKQRGAIVTTMILILIVVLLEAVLLQDPSAPAEGIVLVVLVGGLIVLGAVIALIRRMREIKGGEEDEASKY